MDRRVFLGTLAGGLLAAPLAVEAQQPSKVYRIGYLAQDYDTDRVELIALAGLRQGLQELGYVEGRNLIIEYRWGRLNFDGLPALAAELVQLKVDVIAAVATRAAAAAKQATTTVPIVMTMSLHAVESGLVDSLAHPGGNVTGMTGLADQVIAKQLGLLKEAIPTLSRVAVLWNPTFYNNQPEPQWRALDGVRLLEDHGVHDNASCIRRSAARGRPVYCVFTAGMCSP